MFKIVTNQKFRAATLLFTGDNTVTLVGNSSTSDIALEGEEILGATITRVWSGNAGDSWWDVRRGANTVYVATTSAFMDFAGNGCAITLDQTADLSVNLNDLPADGKGTIMIEIRKVVSGRTDF